jgi:hypothetical protein
VEIYGYSLSSSDVAMSMLLAPLRWRGAVDKNKERIKVYDCSGETLDRYRTFFDGNVTLCKQALG